MIPRRSRSRIFFVMKSLLTSRAYINGFPIFIFIIRQLPKPKIFSRSSEIQLPQRQLLCWAQLDTTLAQQLLCLHWHHMASHGRRRRQYLHTEINSVPIVRLSSRVSALFIRASDCLWLIPICWDGVQQYLHTEMNWNVGLSDEPRVDVLPSAARQEDRSLARDQQLRMKILKWSKFYWCIKIKHGGDLLGPRWRFWRYTVTSGPKDRLQFSVALTCLWLCCLKCLQFLKLRHVFRNLMRSERQLNFEGNTCCFAVVPI